MRERQSNIELLRIVSMFFIVAEHILIMGTDFFSSSLGAPHMVANTIIGFTYIGVNCFILITGYFGAEFSWKRLISLYLICGFYELIGFIIAYVQGDAEMNVTAFSYILFPLSHSNAWFIRCYVILLLFLPILNRGLNGLDKKQFIYVIVLLTILNLYFGWFHKQANFNGDGYNASQMIYLFVIGRYLGKCIDWQHVRNYRKCIIGFWVMLSLFWGIIQNINDMVHVVPHWNGWAYNNPILILSAILFFAYFRCINIKPNKWINFLGATMLGVFLIHINRYMGGYIYDIVKTIVYSPMIADSLVLQVLVLICLAVVLVSIMGIVEMPRMQVHRWVLNKWTNISLYTHTHTHTARPMINYDFVYIIC